MHPPQLCTTSKDDAKKSIDTNRGSEGYIACFKTVVICGFYPTEGNLKSLNILKDIIPRVPRFKRLESLKQDLRKCVGLYSLCSGIKLTQSDGYTVEITTKDWSWSHPPKKP
ncbi:hypothetical protein HZS_6992 [Henneguya salminicola]|nr:hypothetical protein HZS_6992 [Henneguya salminicola]